VAAGDTGCAVAVGGAVAAGDTGCAVAVGGAVAAGDTGCAVVAGDAATGGVAVAAVCPLDAGAGVATGMGVAVGSWIAGSVDPAQPRAVTRSTAVNIPLKYRGPKSLARAFTCSSAVRVGRPRRARNSVGGSVPVDRRSVLTVCYTASQAVGVAG